LCPCNGHAFNQLAVLSSYSHDHLQTLYLYFRALYAKDGPFHVAQDNLANFLKQRNSGNREKVLERLILLIEDAQGLKSLVSCLMCFWNLVLFSDVSAPVKALDSLLNKLNIILFEKLKNSKPRKIVRSLDLSRILVISLCVIENVWERKPEKVHEANLFGFGVTLLCITQILQTLEKDPLKGLWLTESPVLRSLPFPQILMFCDWMRLHIQFALYDDSPVHIKFWSSFTLLLNELMSVQSLVNRKFDHVMNLSSQAFPLEPEGMFGFKLLYSSPSTLILKLDVEAWGVGQYFCNVLNAMLSFGQFLVQKLDVGFK